MPSITFEDATQAWFRELARIAPRIDVTALGSIAEMLAGAEPDELSAVGAQLAALAAVIAEEAPFGR